MSARDLSVRSPLVSPDGADYQSVATDTDLRYRTTASGVKEEIVLRSANSPRQFRFHIADPGGQLGTGHAQPDGSYRFDVTIDGDATLELAPPFAYQEPAPTGSGNGTAAPVAREPGSAHMVVTKSEGGFDLTVSVDANWLMGKQFPVVLDPTWNFANGSGMVAGWTKYSPSGCGGCYGVNTTSSDLGAGTFTNANYDWEPGRSVFKFDVSSIPIGSWISYATMHLYSSGCLGDPSDTTGATYYCDDHSYNVGLHRLNASWDPATATYNSLAAVTDGSAFSTASTGPFSIYFNPCTGCFWMNFNVSNEVSGWINRTTPNNGFVARLADEAYNIGGPSWSYLGVRGQAVGNLPYLEVSFTPNAKSSAETLGNSPSQCHATDHPVNCATGNFWHTFTDIAVPGRGPALDLNRTYNSLDAAYNGPFGYGWRSSYDMSLSISGGIASVRQEDGSEVPFSVIYGSYYGMPRVFDTLVNNGDGTKTFTRRKREKFVFSASGQLLRVVDLNGYTTNLAYNGSNQLATVTDPAGRTFTYSYGANAKVSNVAGPAGLAVSYSYDGAANLTDVTDVGGGNTHFTYDAAHRMLTMRDARGGEVTNAYSANGLVDWQRDALGRLTDFTFQPAYGTMMFTTITDPRGNKIYQYYRDGRLIDLYQGYQSPAEARWSYEYESATLKPTARTDPLGRRTTMTYDPAGNLTSSTDPLLRTTGATYNAFNQPATLTDANNVATTLTYYGAGNLLSRSRPLVGSAQSQATAFGYGDPSHPGDVTSMTVNRTGFLGDS